MRTSIVINDELMNEALNLTEHTTKRSVVEEGLRLPIKLKKQEKIKLLRGKLKWEGDMDGMRLNK